MISSRIRSVMFNISPDWIALFVIVENISGISEVLCQFSDRFFGCNIYIDHLVC